MPNPRTFIKIRDWVEPFWMFALICYVAQCVIQWMKPSNGWMSHYWNDIWMLPCAVPLIIRIYVVLKLRKPSMIPSLSEIVYLGLLWSFMAECLAPLLFSSATADPFDFLAYAFGGGLLWFRWHIYPRLNHVIEFGFR